MRLFGKVRERLCLVIIKCNLCEFRSKKEEDRKSSLIEIEIIKNVALGVEIHFS